MQIYELFFRINSLANHRTGAPFMAVWHQWENESLCFMHNPNRRTMNFIVWSAQPSSFCSLSATWPSDLTFSLFELFVQIAFGLAIDKIYSFRTQSCKGTLSPLTERSHHESHALLNHINLPSFKCNIETNNFEVAKFECWPNGPSRGSHKSSLTEACSLAKSFCSCPTVWRDSRKAPFCLCSKCLVISRSKSDRISTSILFTKNLRTSYRPRSN